jgi:hypothetical protein
LCTQIDRWGEGEKGKKIEQEKNCLKYACKKNRAAATMPLIVAAKITKIAN